MKRRIVNIIMWLVMIAIAASLPIMLNSIDNDIYLDWLKSPEREWEGIIEVWHIVEWKNGGSGTSWLMKRAKAFEKKYNGAFIEILAMSAQEAKLRLDNGERPDVYSFPLGWGDASLLENIDVDLPPLLPSLSSVGVSGRDTYAVPYMVGGYMLIINESIARERGVDTPDELSGEWLASACQKLPYKRGRTQHAALGCDLPLALLELGLPAAQRTTLEAFTSGACGLGVGDMGTLRTLELKASAGKGFSYEAYPLTGFTDQVQLIGVASGSDEEHTKYSKLLIQLLLEESAQRDLESLSVCSAVKLSEPIYTKNERMEAFEAKLDDAFIPNSFAYSNEKAQLVQLAEVTIDGGGNNTELILNALKRLSASDN